MVAAVNQVAKKQVLVKNQAARMVPHTKYGNFNKTTSVFISKLNPLCNEKDIISELKKILANEFADRTGKNSQKD